MAEKLGADHTLRVDTRDAGEMARRVKKALGCKPDVSIECSGAEPSVQTGLYVSHLPLILPSTCEDWVGLLFLNSTKPYLLC